MTLFKMPLPVLHFRRYILSAISSLCLAGGLVSCASNAELEERLDQRNARYSKFQDRRELRNDAVDQRYHDHYDRVMN